MEDSGPNQSQMNDQGEAVEATSAPAASVYMINSNTLADFLPLIPSYDGTSSFQKFLNNFEEIAGHCKWSTNDCILALKLKLKGEAREFLDSQRDLRAENDYSHLISSLRERFSRPLSIATNITRLTSAYQLPSENARQFFSRIEGLSYNCVPDDEGESELAEKYRKQLLLSAAKQGIRHEVLKGVVSSGLGSYAEFKRHALNYEEVINTPDRHIQTNAACMQEPESKFSSLQKQLSELTTAVASLMNRREEKEPVSSPFPREGQQGPPVLPDRCGRCGVRGHLATECRAPFCSNCEQVGHMRRDCGVGNGSLPQRRPPHVNARPPRNYHPQNRPPPPSFNSPRNPLNRNYPPLSSARNTRNQPSNY